MSKSASASASTTCMARATTLGRRTSKPVAKSAALVGSNVSAFNGNKTMALAASKLSQKKSRSTKLAARAEVSFACSAGAGAGAQIHIYIYIYIHRAKGKRETTALRKSVVLRG